MSGSRPEVRHTLGVLFVHGIGQQVRGETLIQSADALYRYFDSRPNSAGHVELEGAALRPEEGPARVEVRFGKSPVDGGRADRSWLLAESWWAESFLAGGFGTLLRWAVRVLPYAMLAHVGTDLRRRWKDFREVRGVVRSTLQVAPLALAVVLLLVAPVMALATMVVLILLSFLSLLPWPALRGPAVWLESKLASTLGDSSILLSSETNRAAMVETIRADLRWLAARSQRVVVVAHSQGAALGWEALQGRIPAKVVAFRTMGSGLRKLLQLVVADRPGRGLVGWAWLSALAQIATITLSYWLVGGLVAGTDQAALVAVGAGLALAFVGLLPLSFVSVSDPGEEPRRWQLALPGVSALAFVMPLLFAWRVEPRWPWHLALLVSLFAALGGVTAVRGLGSRTQWRHGRWLMAAAILAGGALGSLVLWWGSGLLWQGWICLLAALFVALLPLVVAVLEDPVAWDQVRGSLNPRITWKDWYASSDPVPVGHFEPLGEDSREITNLGALLSDHTTYWENADEFVADLGASLAGCDGWSLPQVGSELKARRRWRVQLLQASGWVAWLALAAALWLRGGRFAEVGTEALAATGNLLRSLPLGLGSGLLRLLPESAAWGPVATAALLTTLPILLLKAAFALWWRQWDRREATNAVRGHRFEKEKQPRFLYPFAFYLAAMLCLGLPLDIGLLKLPIIVALVGVMLASVVLNPYFERNAPPAPVD